MKQQGVAIVYVSHRLDEVVALADRCTVLRDGRVAAHRERGAFAVADLVQAMTGRAETSVAADPLVAGDVTIEDATERPDAISLRASEVLGLAGSARQRRRPRVAAVVRPRSCRKPRAHQSRGGPARTPDRAIRAGNRHGAGRARGSAW